MFSMIVSVLLLTVPVFSATRLKSETRLGVIPQSSQIVLPDGRQLCKNTFVKSARPSVDLPGEGQNALDMSHVFTHWSLSPISPDSGSLSVNLFQLYVSLYGEVKVNHAQYANNPDNDEPVRSTWIFSEPISTEWWKGTISLGDGRQLYAKTDGSLSVALPGSSDNTDDARRIWSFPGGPKIKPEELDNEAGTNYKFSIGASGGDEIKIKLAPNDSIAIIKLQIASELAKKGLVKTLPEFYQRWRVVFLSPVQEPSNPHVRLRDLGIDPTVVHKVIPSAIPVVYRQSRILIPQWYTKRSSS